MDNGFLVVMIGNPPLVVPEAMDKVFPSPPIDSEMEKTRIGIPLFKQGYP